MKINHAIWLIALGFLADLFGISKKIMHHPDTTTIFIIALVLKIAGILLLVYMIMHNKKVKNSSRH